MDLGVLLDLGSNAICICIPVGILALLWFPLRDFHRPPGVSQRQNFFLHLLMLGFGGIGLIVALVLMSLLFGDIDMTTYTCNSFNPVAITGLGLTLAGLWVGRRLRNLWLQKLIGKAEDTQTGN